MFDAVVGDYDYILCLFTISNIDNYKITSHIAMQSKKVTKQHGAPVTRSWKHISYPFMTAAIITRNSKRLLQEDNSWWILFNGLMIWEALKVIATSKSVRTQKYFRDTKYHHHTTLILLTPEYNISHHHVCTFPFVACSLSCHHTTIIYKSYCV